jgi:hypothetical protein
MVKSFQFRIDPELNTLSSFLGPPPIAYSRCILLNAQYLQKLCQKLGIGVVLFEHFDLRHYAETNKKC